MGTPTPLSAPTTRRALTIAAAVSLVAAPLLAASPAQAATATKKTIKVNAKQFPTALDRPGTSADLVRLSNVAGVKWTVDAVAQDLGATKTKDIPVTKTAVVVKAEVADTGTMVWSGPSEWTVSFTSEALSIAASDVNVTWVDAPADKDSVIIRKLDGIKWTVGSAEYTPESFGKKTELAIKATSATVVKADLLGATEAKADAADPAAFPKEFTTGLTSAAQVTLADGTVTGAVKVGDNPFDRTKGLGKTASYETVKVTGVAGLKWKVGTDAKAKAYAVKPGVVAYLRVDPDDIHDTTKAVIVTPVADKGYVLATPTIKAEPAFTEAAALEIPVADGVDTDRGGVGSDTLVMPAERNMTWWFGQKDKNNKIVYKAQKVGKDGNATYKVKHTKGATSTDVWVKPVPDRGYVIDATDLAALTPKYNFKTVDDPAGKGWAVGTGTVTLTATDGIDSWTIEDTVATKVVKTTVKRTDLLAAGVTKVVVPTTVTAPVVTAKYAKGYKE